MKYRIKVCNLFFIPLILLLITSCKKDDNSEKLANEKRLIDDYLLTHNKNISPTASGLYFESTEEGSGEQPTLNDFVTINYRATTLDGILFDTSNQLEGRTNNLVTSSAIDGPLKLYMKGINIKGLIEGLLQMREGGKAWMLMPSSIAFGDYVPRIYEVELVKVIHDPVAYEKEKIRNYLDTISQRLALRSVLTPADSTPEGIYYIETLPGTGTNPVAGDNVNVAYTLILIDGQFISSSTNFSFTVGDNSIIPGFNAGIKKMKKGGKALIVMPYQMAYGPNGIIQNGIIQIPMYATLVYNMELKP